MKRIGHTTDGQLIEMTEGDLMHLSATFGLLRDMFDQVKLDLMEDRIIKPVEDVQTHRLQVDRTVTTKGADGSGAKWLKCEQCGMKFIPKRKNSKCCSKACLDKSYRVQKHGVKPVSVAKCISCSRPFEPTRKDQTCCSTKCRKALKTVKPVETATTEVSKADRLAMLKRLASKKGMVKPVPFTAERGGVSPNLEDITEYQNARKMAMKDHES